MKAFLSTLIFSIVFGCANNEQLSSDEKKDAVAVSLYHAKNEKTSYQKRNALTREVISILLSQKNDSINRKKILESTKNFCLLHNWYEMKFAASILLQRAEVENDFFHIAQAYRYHGIFFESVSVNDSAFFYYSKSQKIFLKNKDFKNVCVLYQDKAMVQYYINDYLGAEQSLISALKIAKKNKNRDQFFYIYNQLGINSNEQEQYSNAITYYSKALKNIKYCEIGLQKKNLVTCLNNIGYNFNSWDKKETAIRFYKKAEKFCRINEYPFMYAKLKDNIGILKINQNEMSELPGLFFKASTIRDSLNIDQGKNYNKLYLSEFYMVFKDTTKAIKYAMEAYNLSQSFHAPKDILLCLKHLCKVDPKNALKYTNEYIKISDSMHKLERETRNKFAKIAFETEEISQEKDLAVKQKSIFLGTTITITVIGLLLFVIILQRNRQKELVYQQNQQSAKEEIYQLMHAQQSKLDEGRKIEKRRIARDLHDGIMNKLASVRFNLHILNSKTDESTIKKCLPFIDEIHDIEKEIRDISHNLNKEFFSDNNSFRQILLTFFEEQKLIMKSKLYIDIDNSIKWEQLESSKKVNLYRILQEILQNVNKHAKADNVFISITNQAEFIILEIHDDGVGFAADHKKNGIGLENIRSRAKDCNGIFHFNSNNGNGATMIVSIPMYNANKT